LQSEILARQQQTKRQLNEHKPLELLDLIPKPLQTYLITSIGQLIKQAWKIIEDVQ